MSERPAGDAAVPGTASTTEKKKPDTGQFGIEDEDWTFEQSWPDGYRLWVSGSVALLVADDGMALWDWYRRQWVNVDDYTPMPESWGGGHAMDVDANGHAEVVDAPPKFDVELILPVDPKKP